MRLTVLLLSMMIGLNAAAESAELALELEGEEAASEAQAPMAPQATHTLPKCSSGQYTSKADDANVAAVESALGVGLNSTLHNSAKQASFRLKTSSNVFIVNVSEYSGYNITAEICQVNSKSIRARLRYGGTVRGYVSVINYGSNALKVTELDEKGRIIKENNTPKTGIFRATAAR